LSGLSQPKDSQESTEINSAVFFQFLKDHPKGALTPSKYPIIHSMICPWIKDYLHPRPSCRESKNGDFFIMKRKIAIGLSLLLVALLCACSQQTEKQQDIDSLLPERIGEWQQVQLVSGAEALEQINSLHGKNILVETGAIGTYQAAEKSPAMVWISRSKTPDLTREQAEVMADKMVRNPRSPFHAPETLISNNIKVYKFLGMGQIHYIFCQEELAYWISAPPADGEKLLRYFVENGQNQ